LVPDIQLADPHLHDGIALLAEITRLMRPVLQLDAEFGKRPGNTAEIAGVLHIELPHAGANLVDGIRFLVSWIHGMRTYVNPGV
jgi:hypothetical protein